MLINTEWIDYINYNKKIKEQDIIDWKIHGHSIMKKCNFCGHLLKVHYFTIYETKNEKPIIKICTHLTPNSVLESINIICGCDGESGPTFI